MTEVFLSRQKVRKNVSSVRKRKYFLQNNVYQLIIDSMIYDRSKTDNINFLINELPMKKAEQENYRFCTGDKGKMQRVHPIEFFECKHYISEYKKNHFQFIN
jgi:hypothetical protein